MLQTAVSFQTPGPNVQTSAAAPSRHSYLLPFSSLPLALHSRLVFLVNQFHCLVEGKVAHAPELRGFQLDLRERIVLELLHAVPAGLPQYVIGGHLDLDANLTSQVLARLESRRLIERFRNPSNRRENIVILTRPYGTVFTTKLIGAADRLMSGIVGRLPPGTLDEYTRLARLVLAELERGIVAKLVILGMALRHLGF